jgi:hypothetical protein
MNCLEAMSDIANIITPVVLVGYFLYRQHKVQQRKRWKKYIGCWGNEGVVNEPIPEFFIELELEVDLEDGEIGGILNVRKTNDEFEEKNISINGNIKCKDAFVSLTNIKREGILIEYGSVNLKLERKNLKWELINGDINYFPKEVFLHRTLSSKPV